MNGSETLKSPNRWKRWLVIGVIAGAALVVGGPFLYFNVIADEPPPPLALTTTAPTETSSSESVPVEGTWTVASGSRVGYRVKEVLFGQSQDAVGRTDEVEGSLTIDGTTVRTATFTVDMTSVASDQERRDRQFRGRIMDTASHPTATFTLSQPIELGSIPPEGVQGTARATGRLTLHGTTKTVTFTITGRRTSSSIQVSGSIPIIFAEWGIPNPSFGPAETEDNGSLEFLLNFNHA